MLVSNRYYELTLFCQLFANSSISFSVCSYSIKVNIYVYFVQEEQFVTKLEVRIHIPDDLRQWLVDDWDLVTRQKHVSRLTVLT